MSTLRVFASAALLTGLVAAGCSSSSKSTGSSASASSTVATKATTATAQPAQGGHLTFAVDTYPQDMDPLSPTVDILSLQIFDSWWEYLVKPSPDGSTFQPMLATSWTVSPDDKTYTFQLRQGVKFSDGSPMTTDDVIASLHAAFTANGSQINFLAKQVASVTAPTPASIQVQMNTPWPYLLADLSGFNAAILPYHLINTETYKTFLTKPVGTGPFMLSTTSAGSSITVVRNPNYWEPGHPYLDSITFATTPSDVARATAVTGGQADLIEDPPLNQVSGLKANSALQLYDVPASEVETILTNVKTAPLNNALIRKAISLALDRTAIVKAALFGYGHPATTFIVPPAAETLQDPSLNLYPYDPKQAAALVKQSGLPTPVSVTFSLSQGATQDAIAAIAQQELQAVGIKANITRSDFTTNETNINTGNFTMATTYWSDYVGDPSEQPLFWMDPGYCCQAYFTFYNDATAISLVHQAVAATDTSQVKSLFDQVQQSVAASAHAIPLYYPDQIYVSTAKVTGFTPNPFGYWYFDNLALKK